MVHTTERGQIKAIPVIGRDAISKLRGEVYSFLKDFDVDMQSFNKNSYFIIGRFTSGEEKGKIAFVFVRKRNANSEFFCENNLKTDIKVFELASRAWNAHFKLA